MTAMTAATHRDFTQHLDDIHRDGCDAHSMSRMLHASPRHERLARTVVAVRACQGAWRGDVRPPRSGNGRPAGPLSSWRAARPTPTTAAKGFGDGVRSRAPADKKVGSAKPEARGVDAGAHAPKLGGTIGAIEWFERWQRGRDPGAREQLLARLLPLARKLVPRYSSGRSRGRASHQPDPSLIPAGSGRLTSPVHDRAWPGHAFATRRGQLPCPNMPAE